MSCDGEFAARCRAIVDRKTPVEIAAVDDLIAEFYDMPGNIVGGQLHIVLDDSNIKDSHIDYCIARSVEASDIEAEWLGRALRSMSYDERNQLASLCECCRDARLEERDDAV